MLDLSILTGKGQFELEQLQRIEGQIRRIAPEADFRKPNLGITSERNMDGKKLTALGDLVMAMDDTGSVSSEDMSQLQEHLANAALASRCCESKGCREKVYRASGINLVPTESPSGGRQ